MGLERGSIATDPGDSRISYTQFSMYMTCPRSWELAYARNLRSKEPTIHLLFGTAMHNTIQEWLIQLYGGEGKPIKLNESLHHQMVSVFSDLVETHDPSFTSLTEIDEFYNDGVDILNVLRKDYWKYFNPTQTKLVGIEYPILVTPIETKPNVKLVGYLDIVLSDDGHYIIQDLKTSTRGWSDYQKVDITKISQLLIYKYYFSELNNLKLSDVQVQYIILNRKLKEKIELFIPKQTSAATKTVIDRLREFIDYAFDDRGQVRLDVGYPAVSGYGYENCKFCEFRDREDLCPVSKRIPDIALK